MYLALGSQESAAFTIRPSSETEPGRLSTGGWDNARLAVDLPGRGNQPIPGENNRVYTGRAWE